MFSRTLLLWTIIVLTFCFIMTAASGVESKTALPKGSDENTDSFARLITIEADSITVLPGKFKTATGEIEVKASATFTIDPAEIISVKDEAILLSAQKPQSWGSGTPLAGPNAQDINAGGSYVAGSISMSKTPGGVNLIEGKDYLVSPEFAMVGLAPGSSVSSVKPVFATYKYSLLRVDSVVVDVQGKAHLLKGKSHLTRPQQPDLTTGTSRLLNIFCPYHATALKREDIYPILERADQAVTKTTKGRIPKTLAKIKGSHGVRIVCLGDSVTAGGNASSLEMMYSEVFRRNIMKRYIGPSPYAVRFVSINVINESYPGSRSSQWLGIGPLKNYMKEHPEMLGKERIDFQRVLDLKPDLVTVEFVNDASFTYPELEQIYGKMADELNKIGAEMILITPHFTALSVMDAKSMRTEETRPYVRFLYEFAEKHNLGIADASARWAHLWKEGIPYITLLDNSYNHPDDRGHLFFAEEIMKNFE